MCSTDNKNVLKNVVWIFGEYQAVTVLVTRGEQYLLIGLQLHVGHKFLELDMSIM
jgi:hypothetical protein